MRYLKSVCTIWGPALLCTLGGGAVRLCALQESLWLDELHTAWCVSGAFAEVAPRAMIGNQAPLFYWAEWWTALWIAKSDWSLRLLPWAASTGTIAWVYWSVYQRSASPVWSCAIAALAALDGHCLFYGSEARPYGLIPLVAFVHLDSLWSLCRPPPNERSCRATFSIWASWVASGALLMHLHIATLWFLVWEYALLWGGRAVYGPGCLGKRQLLSGGIALVVAFLPLLPLAHTVRQRLPTFTPMVPPPHLIELLSLLNLGYYVAVGCLLLLLVPKAGRENVPAACGRTGVVLSFLLWLLPVASAWLATRIGALPLFFPRYLIALQAPAWLFLAACGAALKPKHRGVLVNGLTVLLFGLVLTYTSYPRWMQLIRGESLRGEDWRAALGVLQKQLGPNDVILLRPGLIETEQLVDRPAPGSLEYEYLRFPLRIFYSPALHTAEIVLLDNSNTPTFSNHDLTTLVRASHLYLLIRGNAWQAEQLAHYVTLLLSNTKIVTSVRSFGRVQLVVLSPAGSTMN